MGLTHCPRARSLKAAPPRATRVAHYLLRTRMAITTVQAVVPLGKITRGHQAVARIWLRLSRNRVFRKQARRQFLMDNQLASMPLRPRPPPRWRISSRAASFPLRSSLRRGLFPLLGALHHPRVSSLQLLRPTNLHHRHRGWLRYLQTITSHQTRETTRFSTTQHSTRCLSKRAKSYSTVMTGKA